MKSESQKIVIYFYLLIIFAANLNYLYGEQNFDYNDGHHGHHQHHEHPHHPHHPPLVTVNNDYGKHVGVHVPHIYNMDLRKDPLTGLGMGINVLNGLVRINMNRNRNPFSGRKSGPISVEVGGVPIFNKLH